VGNERRLGRCTFTTLTTEPLLLLLSIKGVADDIRHIKKSVYRVVKFCHLGDMLGADGKSDSAITEISQSYMVKVPEYLST